MTLLLKALTALKCLTAFHAYRLRAMLWPLLVSRRCAILLMADYWKCPMMPSPCNWKTCRHRASRKSKCSPHHQQNMLQAPMWHLSASPHATSRLARVAACGVVALLVRISVICWAAIYLTQLAKLNYRSMPVGVITGALMTLTAPTHSAITRKSRNVAHTSLIVRLVWMDFSSINSPIDLMQV